MARVVIHHACEPARIIIRGEEKWICLCGLSQNPPFCEGQHIRTEGEQPGKLYLYKDGKRWLVEIRFIEEKGETTL